MSTGLRKKYLHISDFTDLNEQYLKNQDRNLFFEIYWQAHEKPLTFLEKTDWSVDGDSFYLVPPFRDYEYDKDGKSGVLIAFHKDILTYEAKEFSLNIYKLFGRDGEFSTLFIDRKNIRTLRTILELLKTELAEKTANILLQRTILKAFLLKLMDSADHELVSPGINEKRIYHFVLLLEDHYITEKSVDFYATKLNLSAKRLNQILKQKTGKTISQILQERTLTEAKHLLFVGKKSIKEIAYTLGFQDASYFSRFFKKMTKLSPEEFRIQTKNQIAFKKR